MPNSIACDLHSGCCDIHCGCMHPWDNGQLWHCCMPSCKSQIICLAPEVHLELQAVNENLYQVYLVFQGDRVLYTYSHNYVYVEKVFQILHNNVEAIMAGFYCEKDGITTLPPQLTSPLEGKFLYGEKQQESQVDPFQAGIYPITNGQYAQFIEAGGYDNEIWWSHAGWWFRQYRAWTQPRYWDHSSYNVANQPVVGVSWYEAEAFCRWLSAEYGQHYRLPTELEWERLVRGVDGRIYTWGNQWQSGRANTYAARLKRPTAVGLFAQSPSPSGAYDCVGNVWDWCLDWYDDDNDARVLRGGSFVSFLYDARCAYRSSDPPQSCDYNIGFRVVLSP